MSQARVRASQWWNAMEWPMVAGAAVLTIALGYIGFQQFYVHAHDPQNATNLLYLTLQLFVLQSGWVDAPVPLALDIARFLAPALAAYTAINALAVLFSAQLSLLRLRAARDHTVICGLGRKGATLAEALRARGDRVVAVERDDDQPGVACAREAGATVITGDATTSYVLSRAGVAQAARLVCLCDDATNAAIVMAAGGIPRRRGRSRLTCHVHLTDYEVWRLMSEREMLPGEPTDDIHIEFFNAYDAAAAILLDAHGRFAPHGGSSGLRPHIIIVGLGNLAQSIIVHVARSWHLDGEISAHRPLITAIDYRAVEKMEALRLRFPSLSAACDLNPLDMDVKSPAFESAAFVSGPDGERAEATVYICFDDDGRSLQAALTLSQHVRDRGAKIVARMAGGRGLAHLLDSPGMSVTPFPLLSLTCTPERVFESAHERLARALCKERTAPTGGSDRGADGREDSWSVLAESKRQEWRRRADQVSRTLERAAYRIAPLNDWRVEPRRFTETEVELMTTEGPDPAAVRALPSLLAQAGLTVYRMPQHVHDSGGTT